MKTRKDKFLIIFLIIILAILAFLFLVPRNSEKRINLGEITNFQECLEAGYPIMESYPRQCAVPGGETYVEEIEDDLLVGGDRDEHGCIGSAGYSWCEPKNKCLRIWEEACYQNIQEEIQYILAQKYNYSPEEVNVTILKETDYFLSGSVIFGEGGPGEGGMFLAAKIDNVWQVVFDGNGSVDCAKMKLEYGFPDEVLRPHFCD